MNRLPKEKRNKLLLVILLVAGVLSGLWCGLINPQQQNLRNLGERQEVAKRKLQQVKESIDAADEIEAQLGEASQQLTKIESGMASGDLYSWAITTIRQFKQPYKLDIPQFSQIDGPKDVSLLPAFPYKQATLTISGTTYYHDFGRFVADFENQFPYVRISNVSLEQVSGGTAADREKLSFKMDITALVKPGAS